MLEEVSSLNSRSTSFGEMTYAVAPERVLRNHRSRWNSAEGP